VRKSTIGISMGRRELCIVSAIGDKNNCTITYKSNYNIPDPKNVSAILRQALQELPSNDISCVRIALSPAFLACAGIIDVPYRKESQVAQVAKSLAEATCAGETAEEIEVDFQVGERTASGSSIELIAVRKAALIQIIDTVHAILPSCRIDTISALNAVLAESLQCAPAKVIEFPGEAAILSMEGRFSRCRMFPWNSSPDAPDDTSARLAKLGVPAGATFYDKDADILVSGRETKARYSGAAAVLFANQSHVPNLMRPLNQSWSAPVYTQLRVAAIAASVLLLALGFLFNRQKDAQDGELQMLAAVEESLWKSAWPAEPFKQDELLPKVKRILTEHKKLCEANSFPSALKFWAEFAASMPDPDKLDFSLESLQLSSVEGRMVARVAAPPDKQLSNAAEFEAALNSSKRIKARADYERRESEIVMRVRMDYRAEQGAGSTVP
jgi:hypothetical protein